MSPELKTYKKMPDTEKKKTHLILRDTWVRARFGQPFF